MRLAVWEILYEEDVPGRVAINEAVEIAGRYGNSDSSGSFINGVLGSIYRDWEKKQKTPENPQ
jgi:N utilization substance protein B